MTKYAFVSAERANHAVATLCRVVGCSVSGFYAWLRAIPAAQHRAEAEADLRGRIGRIFAARRRVYGAPRIHAELRRAYFETPWDPADLPREVKADGSVVTRADRAVEASGIGGQVRPVHAQGADPPGQPQLVEHELELDLLGRRQPGERLPAVARADPAPRVEGPLHQVPVPAQREVPVRLAHRQLPARDGLRRVDAVPGQRLLQVAGRARRRVRRVDHRLAAGEAALQPGAHARPLPPGLRDEELVAVVGARRRSVAIGPARTGHLRHGASPVRSVQPPTTALDTHTP